MPNQHSMEAGPRWMPLAVEMIDNNFAVMMYNALDQLSENGSDVNLKSK